MFLFIFGLLILFHHTIICSNAVDTDDDELKFINDKIYSNIFIRRREEQKTLLNHFAVKDMYETKYKMLKIGLEKILTVLKDSRDFFEKENYSPEKNGFPQGNHRLIDPFALVVENTCLFGELILHLPEMSYKILKNQNENWKTLLNWSLDFTKNFYNTIIDKNTQEMLSIFDQEINPEKRTEDFDVKYQEITTTMDKKVKISEPIVEPVKKSKKKVKKGPSLGGSKTEL